MPRSVRGLINANSAASNLFWSMCELPFSATESPRWKLTLGHPLGWVVVRLRAAVSQNYWLLLLLCASDDLLERERRRYESLWRWCSHLGCCLEL